MFKTIRARLLWLVGLSLGPALAILAYNEFVFRQQAFTRIQGDAHRAVSLAAQRLEQQIVQARNRAQLLAQFPQVRALDRSADSLLAGALAADPVTANLAVVDLAGHVVSSAVRFRSDVFVGDFAFFRQDGGHPRLRGRHLRTKPDHSSHEPQPGIPNPG